MLDAEKCLLPASFRLDGTRLSLDPRDESFYRNPYSVYRELHCRAPIVFWDEAGCAALSGHGAISTLLRDRRFGRIVPDDAGRTDYGPAALELPDFYGVERHSLLDLEPPAHTRLRGLVHRAFVSRRIEALAPRIAALADTLIDHFASDGSVELVEAFAEPLPVIVIAELLGIDPSHRADMLEWSHRMVAMYQFGKDAAVERSANAAARDYSAFMRMVIAEKTRKPGDDLVSNLIAAQEDGGRLSTDEMVSTLILLMNAGHEATVHQIGNGVASILACGLSAPEMFSDEERAARTVEEVLRFDTPLHLFRRIALQDVEIAPGIVLARGEAVALLLGAGNRDPEAYADPDRFEPTRNGPAPLTFGAGIHFCIGAPLARLELRIALGTLFRRLPELALATEPRFRDSFHFRGLERLDLRFRPSGSSI